MNHSSLGQETIPADEPLYIEKIIQDLKTLLEKKYPSGEMLRAFHPKIHGLLRAKLIVEPNLPEKFKVGLFAEEREYQAWIRLSNGKRDPQEDIKKDLRGMAIKLVDVPGEKILLEKKNASTHDFLLLTHPTMQIDTVKAFQEGIAATLGGRMSMIAYALNPKHWAILKRSVQALKKFSNILDAQFWSTTPYRFGRENIAVKYSVRPQSPFNTPYPENPSNDFLREQLAKDLLSHEVNLDFLIQIQTDAEGMPIEDPTVEWEAPYIKVATIKIPKQQFDTELQREYAKTLSFNPWHCLPEHMPLGGVNRARKDTYEALSKFRMEKSGWEPLTEPSDLSIPIKETKAN